MEAGKCPVVMESLVFCLSWGGDPAKKRVKEEFWAFSAAALGLELCFRPVLSRGCNSFALILARSSSVLVWVRKG